MMSHYRIPREISSELKITKGIFLYDLLLIVSLILFRFVTLGLVHSKFQGFYTLLLIAFGIFLVIRPKSNPQKRMYQAIYLAFIMLSQKTPSSRSAASRWEMNANTPYGVFFFATEHMFW